MTGAAAHMSLHLTNNVKEPGDLPVPVLATGGVAPTRNPALWAVCRVLVKSETSHPVAGCRKRLCEEPAT